MVLSLTLAEPVCLDLARGGPAVEAHIGAMEPVFAVRHDRDVSNGEFCLRFAAAMGAPIPSAPAAALDRHGARLRAMPPPWGTALTTLAALPVSTLVVTGGWHPLYDEVAEALVGLGARHVELAGGGHRVQDAPSFNEVMLDHWDTTG